MHRPLPATRMARASPNTCPSSDTTNAYYASSGQGAAVPPGINPARFHSCTARTTPCSGAVSAPAIAQAEILSIFISRFRRAAAHAAPLRFRHSYSMDGIRARFIRGR
ncbi:hypothetical protein BD779DRAFT_1580684 [Infundibulicybe gibba]|nr:hypothetical protein BD779DRAFT_1580684 [Infundibulicybe gibba]